MHSDKEIAAFLNKHNGFSEGIIEELSLTDYGTTFEIRMTHDWAKPDGEKTWPAPKFVILRFRLMQELHITNALTPPMLRSPESINWGLNEVAIVKLLANEAPFSLGRNYPGFHRLAFLWEGERRIDVVFSELEVVLPE